MARKARIRAASGIYYVRINSFSPLFLQERDLTELLNLLTAAKETDFCEVYAYCLIDCEAHLVVKEGLSGISDNIMRLKSGFASYYNTIYVRKGSLFKDRFFSLPLEDNADVLKSVRAVHRVPLSLGYKIDFEGSSYNAYFKNSPLLSSTEITSLFKSIVDFKIFNEDGEDSEQERKIGQDNTEAETAKNGQDNTEAETAKTGQDNAENQAESNGGTTAFNAPQDETDTTALKKRIRELLSEVTQEELDALTDSQYKLLIKRIIELTSSTPQAVAKILGVNVEDIQ